MDFSAIFEAHYFSNHYRQAMALEAKLERDDYPGRQCVTFSGLPALAVTVSLEMVDAASRLVEVSRRSSTCATLDALNRFLQATGREGILKATPQESLCWQEELEGLADADLLLVHQGRIKGMIMDLSDRHPMLASAAVFVTSDDALAEKVRWARSSYGRRAPADIRVAANGRFSEFQAALLLTAL